MFIHHAVWQGIFRYPQTYYMYVTIFIGHLFGELMQTLQTQFRYRMWWVSKVYTVCLHGFLCKNENTHQKTLIKSFLSESELLKEKNLLLHEQIIFRICSLRSKLFSLILNPQSCGSLSSKAGNRKSLQLFFFEKWEIIISAVNFPCFRWIQV